MEEEVERVKKEYEEKQRKKKEEKEAKDKEKDKDKDKSDEKEKEGGEKKDENEKPKSPSNETVRASTRGDFCCFHMNPCRERVLQKANVCVILFPRNRRQSRPKRRKSLACSRCTGQPPLPHVLTFTAVPNYQLNLNTTHSHHDD